MANITRIKNNQVTDNTIEYQKLKDGTLVGSKFNANLTLNSNVTILGNLTVANSFAQLNSINTYINDPLVVFNNNYTGSPTYDIGMLVNRNLSSLAPYGAVNAAFVWKEADNSFETLMTTETGTTAGSINNSGWANLKVGNLTAVTATINGSLTAGSASFASINNTPIGNATPAIGSFTYLTAVNGFQTGNAVINGGYISAVANIGSTYGTFTNLASGNAVITGGYITGVANVGSTYGTFTNLASGNVVISGGYISTLTNATITTATVTNETATNFYSGNVYISGGYINNLANIAAGTGYITNLNSTNGNVTTLVATNFSSGNVVISGGYISAVANIGSTYGTFTNLATGNAVITGGYISAVANIGATYGTFTNLASGNAVITGSSTYIGTGATPIANAYVSTGYFTNLSASNVTLVTENVTTLQATNFSSPNAVITGGSVNNSPIGNATPSTAAFTTLTASGATTLTGTTESTTSSNGALIVSGGVGIAKNLNVGGSVVVTGNLTVQGTTTTVNSTTVDVADINITVAKGAASAAAANGGGLTVDGANATLLYTSATDSWNVNKQFIGLGAQFSNTTPSTSSSTGALIVSGGVGVAGDVYAYRVNATYGNITTGYFGSLNTANAVISGGYISAVANIGATYGTFTNLASGNAVITGGSITSLTTLTATTLQATNLSTGNAVITGGYITGLANVGTTYLTTTNLNASNAVVTGGSINNTVIGNTTPAAATFTQLNTTGVTYHGGNIVANSLTPSTSTTTGAIVIPADGGIGIGGNINAGVYETSLHNIRGNLLLGLGSTQANDSELTINLNTTDPIPSNAILHMSGSPNKDAFYGVDAFGTGIPRVALRRAKGTPSSPTAIQANDSIGSFSARGYGATGYVTSTTQSSLQFHANENYTDTAQGTYATISVVPNGTVNPIYGIVIGGNGTVTVPVAVSSIGSSTGALVVHGGTGIGEDLNVGGNTIIAGSVDVVGTAMFENTSTFRGNVLANSTTNSTGISSGALVVAGGVGIYSNVNIGGSTVLNANSTAGFDTIVKGANDSTLIWARPSATYDQVLIGNSATVSTLVRGAKLQINSTDSMLLPTGTTAQRPSNSGGSDVTGMFRYNTTLGYIEFYTGSSWNGVTTQFTVITDEQFNGDGVTVSFTLGGATTTAGTIVSINGVIQIPTLAYSCSGTTLTFTEAPDATDVIDVRRLTTTQSITSIASVNGYMGLVCDNTGANITTGTGSATVTTSFNTTGAQVSYIANVSVASANTATTIDTVDTTKYRSAKYIVQVTNGASYQVQEVLVISNGTTATATTYGVVTTNGNLGVISATQSGSNTLLQFIAANATNNVRIKKDYLAV